MAQSDIEWTELTWNPTTGCTKISPGCKNCYAERMSARLHSMRAAGYEKGFQLALHENRLLYPMTVRRPSVFFVNSMSDLFHKGVPDAFIDRVMDTIARVPRHTFQILTKRADRLAHYWQSRVVPSNAWIGVSVENKRHGVPRIDALRSVPAALRFLSVEPLLEDVGSLNLAGIHWVIVGGESGPRARRMDPAWARNVRDQCIRQRVPFFFKQWGAWSEVGEWRNKKVNGRLLDGQEWNQMPAVAESSDVFDDVPGDSKSSTLCFRARIATAEVQSV